MNDDRKRIDLSFELEQSNAELLRSINAAANEAKQRKAAQRVQEAKELQRAKSKKMQAILVAIGAVLVLLISYWMVFAGSGNNATQQTTASIHSTEVQTVTPVVGNTRAACPSAPTAPVPSASSLGRDAQTVTRPPDHYEQPSEDSGM